MTFSLSWNFLSNLSLNILVEICNTFWYFALPTYFPVILILCCWYFSLTLPSQCCDFCLILPPSPGRLDKQKQEENFESRKEQLYVSQAIPLNYFLWKCWLCITSSLCRSIRSQECLLHWKGTKDYWAAKTPLWTCCFVLRAYTLIIAFFFFLYLRVFFIAVQTGHKHSFGSCV